MINQDADETRRPLLPEEEEIIGPDDDDDGPPEGLPADLWF
jgi:hypothetical protein